MKILHRQCSDRNSKSSAARESPPSVSRQELKIVSLQGVRHLGFSMLWQQEGRIFTTWHSCLPNDVECLSTKDIISKRTYSLVQSK
jgi:hypothetical protein